MSEEPAKPPITYCPLCGRELWAQNGIGSKMEISQKGDKKFGIIKNVLSFCDKCNVMYVFNRELDGFTVRAIAHEK